MTPNTYDYDNPELSYDNFSDANGSIFRKLKMEKIGFKVMATIFSVSSLYYKNSSLYMLKPNRFFGQTWNFLCSFLD